MMFYRKSFLYCLLCQLPKYINIPNRTSMLAGVWNSQGWHRRWLEIAGVGGRRWLVGDEVSNKSLQSDCWLPPTPPVACKNNTQIFISHTLVQGRHPTCFLLQVNELQCIWKLLTVLISTICYVLALFQKGFNSLFSWKFFKQAPILTTWKKFNIFANIFKIKGGKIICTNVFTAFTQYLMNQLHPQVFLTLKPQACHTYLWAVSPIFLCSASQAQPFSHLSFSIGFKSGLRLGHTRTITELSHSHSFVILTAYLGSLSCWKMNLHPHLRFRVSFSGIILIFMVWVVPFGKLQADCHKILPLYHKDLIDRVP